MKGRGKTKTRQSVCFVWPSGIKPPLRAHLPLVWTGVKLDLNSAFRVGKAVYRGLALDHYCFALVRPVLEGGYCEFGREAGGVPGPAVYRPSSQPKTV